jgi:hypothetical protein
MLAGGAASFLVAGAMAAAPATAVSAGTSSTPPGHNATIKINNTDVDSNVNNEPHVSCPFTLSGYNFDTGSGVANTATVTFYAWPLSGHGQVLAPADGASSFSFKGATFRDTYSFSATTLASLALQANQGYHVKVNVSVATTGLRTTGRATHAKTTSKFKVFWLTCTPPTPTQSPTPTLTPTVSPTETVTVSPTETVTVSPSQSSQGATVLPTKTSKPTQGTSVLPTKAVRPPGNLPFTGLAPTTTRVLIPLGLGFVLTGLGLIGLTRRIHQGAHL